MSATGGIVINPYGQTLVVTITSANSGRVLQLYSDPELQTPVANPITISSRQPLYVGERLVGNVSCALAGVEVATAAGTALSYDFSTGGFSEIGVSSPRAANEQPASPLTRYESASLWVYGHSYVTAAAAGTTAGAEYYNRVKNRLGMQAVTSYGVASSRLVDVVYDIQTEYTGTGPSVVGSTWAPARRGVAILHAMFNDALNPADSAADPPPVALTAEQVTTWGRGLVAALAHLCSSSRVDSTTGTTSGTWTTGATSTAASYSGGSVLRSTVQGSYVDIPVTVPASGVVYVISYVAAGSTGDLAFTIGGVTVGTLAGTTLAAGSTVYSRRRVAARGTFPVAVKLSGLTPGATTIRATKTDATANIVFVDTLLPQATYPPLIFVMRDQAPAASALTLANAEPGRSVIVANLALLNAEVTAAVVDFPTAKTLDMSTVLSAADVMSTDGLHPNDRGMRKIADALVPALVASEVSGLYPVL